MGCSLCPVRTYVSITGAAECHNCLTRLSSFSGSATCNICDEGFFRRDALTEATTESCKLCFEKGARCPTNTTLETVVVLPGFWRLSNRSKQMIKCKGSAAVKRCIGGMDAGFSGEGYCSERYTGPEHVCSAVKAKASTVTMMNASTALRWGEGSQCWRVWWWPFR